MKLATTFNALLNELRGAYEHCSFTYSDPTQSFRACVRNHFRGGAKQYGVYIVRSHTQVLYIGKGGTVSNDGSLKGQDIIERLRNVRDSRIAADAWLRELLIRGHPLQVECFMWSRPKSPAFLEALLLQTYLNQHHNLPQKNRSL